MADLYRAFDVWKRLSPTRLLRYRCFENLSSQLFSVQSADFYSIPLDSKQFADLERQFVDLICEQTPDSRVGAFRSVEEAINAYEKDFGDADGDIPNLRGNKKS